MAAVEVTISGVLYDKLSRSTRPVVIIGEASLTGLEVGGGPMPPGSGGGGSPPGIWGPTDPRPTPPIHLPGGPGGGGGQPPGIWPSPGPLPHPEHPIVIPEPPPVDPATPPIEWKAVWHPTAGWIVVGVPQFEHPAPASK